ncbi:MAG TPA: SusC/RagA family TonB-linked outer membrane protein [Pedobacter sp.]|nr:SusC/RagA family TonB-linked outer membrane protein [Pedobacter sp.]
MEFYTSNLGGLRHWLPPKIILIMKLIVVILTSCLMQVSAAGFAQKLTYSKQGATLGQIFTEIRKQTGYFVVYADDKIDAESKLDVNFKNTDLKDVLSTIGKSKGLNYTIDDKNISFKPKEAPSFLERVIDRIMAIDVRGTVVDEKGQPLAGATVKVKGVNNAVTTNNQGEFYIKGVDEDAVLQISYIGYKTQEIKTSSNVGEVKMELGNSDLDEVSVVSTGYQTLPKERTTGSFGKIDIELINRNVGPDLISRLNGLAPSLLIDQRRTGENKLSIRGRSTIFANDQPLIVVDNFPYDGDLNTINPNDIENITILRDAAAASIWGVRASNGVIVVTTKKGKKNRLPQISMNSNVTIGDKPDQFYRSAMSSSDFIENERFLFNNGYYDSDINDVVSFPALTPAVELLNRQRNGDITEAEANALFDVLKKQDTRREVDKYFFQKSLSQQYSVNLSGGSDKNTYYFTAGYDKNKSNQVNNGNDRLTLNGQNTYTPIKNLEISTGIVYTQSKNDIDNTLGLLSNITRPVPYAKFTDESGTPVPITYKFRNTFIESAEANGFLNWGFNPINELGYTEFVKKLKNLRFNTGLTYTIIEGLNVDLKYQYMKQDGTGSNYSSVDSYYARDLINKYSRRDGAGVVDLRNIPLGGILVLDNTNLTSNNGRAQVNFNKEWSVHAVSVLGGFEAREIVGESNSNYLYGYDVKLGTSAPVNFDSGFFLYPIFAISRIPGGGSQVSGTMDRFRSYFFNGAYTFDSRYVLSLSGRIDQSNLFGVNTNQKSNPLWSIGGKWNIDKEKFFSNDWLSLLKLRATYGYNGNIDQSTTAFATGSLNFGGFTGRNAVKIDNPPNPNLTWEKSGILNIGLDFGLKDNRIEGSLDYYTKKGTNLFGYAPLDPTTGFITYKGNVADTKGHGLDLLVKTVNINADFKWLTSVMLSYTVDKVVNYKVKESSAGNFMGGANAGLGGLVSPVEGRPLFGIYSNKWAGLDPVTGSPRGYLNGVPSMDYATIGSTATVDSLVYNGRATPPVFGAIRNTFNYKGLSFSLNVVYRFGYYFRRESISYEALYSGNIGHGDYANRWKNPGDEKHTDVPSRVFPNNQQRDTFYNLSEVLVDKADNIRLQDLQVSYDFGQIKLGKGSIRAVQVYSYINNAGMIWTATKSNVDPDFPAIKLPRTYAFGVRLTL